MTRKIAACFAGALLAVLSIAVASRASAAVPQTMNYQGYLTDSSGQPVNGTVSITFSLYDSASGGTLLWTETQGPMAVSKGVYSVVLGSITPLTLPFDAQYWLGVKVGADSEMTPRQALTSVPYARNAEMVGGQKLSDLDGRYISGPSPSRALKTNIISTLDPAGNTGQYTSLTIGTDGFPIVSYYDVSNGDLKIVHCTDAACSTSDSPRTLDSAGNVGFYTSIAIGTDGFPVISYMDASNYDPKIVHCTNASCSTNDAPRVLDPAGYSGFYASMTIGADGFPIISYHSGEPVGLAVIHCTNVSCSANDAPSLLAPSTGDYSSITIGTDGFPIIAWWNGVVHCTNAACSTNDAPVAGGTNSDNSMTIGTDGFPVISYHALSSQDLAVTHCTHALCSTRTIVGADSAGDVGKYSSIAIGADGFPVISYYDATNGDLKIVHCTNASCSTSDSPRTLDSAGDVGKYTSIAIGTDGLPVISYYDVSNGDLKVLKCANQYCLNNWGRR